MRSSFLIVALTMAAMPVGAAGQTSFLVESTGVASADAELASLRAEYAAAANAADAGRLSALYANDAIAVPREGVMLRGREEIQRYSHDAFASRASRSTVTLTPQTFEVQGHMASETGTFSESQTGNDGPAATGVYVAIYTRAADGTWRISMEVRSRGRDKQVVTW
jgi:uncharacterized protein (TIGR02246 family)